MNEHSGTSLKEVWESFIISQTSRGVSEATIKNYHNHLKSISHRIDIEMPMDALTKRHLEQMVVSMRRAGLAHNSIATYLRVTNTFLRWCQREGVPNLKEKDTVKEIKCACYLFDRRCPVWGFPLKYEFNKNYQLNLWICTNEVDPWGENP